MRTDFDIIVIGGGPAGLCFAALMADSGLSVCVLEQRDKKTWAEPAYDGREIALTHLSRQLTERAGIWQRITPKAISSIKRAEAINGLSGDVIRFNPEGTGRDRLGFLVSNHLIAKAAYEAASVCVNVTLRDKTSVADVSYAARHVAVHLQNGRKLTARLAVAADGRFSQTRRIAGITTSQRDFGRICIVCRMSISGEHGSTAREYFIDERTLAVLPMNENKCSVVLTLEPVQAEEILGLDAARFSQEMTEWTEGKFGTMTLDSGLHPYPLVGVYARKFSHERLALLGDAAVGMHPVTAHGFNLGLKGASTLARRVQETARLGGDIGSEECLREYENKHRAATLPLYLATNLLVQIYTKTSPLSAIARRTLMRAGAAFGPARRIVTRSLTSAN
jgi:ubiquinone biosynthesis UbiH/UbiF/VisC/COQ6 family hydroxylase